MKNIKIEIKAEREFQRFARKHLMKPKKCKRIEQANHCIHLMYQMIQEFKTKFNYVPASAQLMFNEYQNIQDRMVYEIFRQSYQNVLC